MNSRKRFARCSRLASRNQGAQLATFFVARAHLRFVSGARFLVGPLAALLFLLLRAFRFGQAGDGSNDAAQPRVDEAAFRVVPLP